MTGSVGFFGKMPGMGDFLRLNLPAGFVQSWDSWLQEAMIAARATLGAQWDERYLSAPIWRFSLPPLAGGQPAMSGVVMPSVDRVGRQYPLTLAAPCPNGSAALRHFANDGFFDMLETHALATLEEDLTRELLAARLDGIAPRLPDEMPVSPDGYAGGVRPEHRLAARGIDDQFPGSGIWTSASEGDHRMFLTRGLPDARQFTGMIDPEAAMWRPNAVARTA
ncbi:hypothetical protein OB2597_13508 [Pseudooceanicola batsensis HTCC2597]|uniref:Type VI secretion system-associated protein TagF n=1 Tax=Pseudooceanicola batsensis (strain ATCC BAA-863 / DSM 15984 / KCTC 12145 / HTCC2597) TaxID=252305 RepID=A3TYD0_PSEBH|nr:type VI secretion system-associated protein TagF [Pseudooceanicola batsensis]EAQ03164.1 hypothetical protein OB2597_13508 [Pseudooceanicola batsensis HTCC2597]